MTPTSALRFEALVRTHYAGLCSFVARIVRSRVEAEDIVQTMFANLWAQRDTFHYERPEAYLYRAARNRAINVLRRQRVRLTWEEQAKARPPEPTEPTVTSDAAELRAAIDRAVAELPERCRLIFTMNREQGLRYAEVAQILGISVKTVETQMGRALKVLRLRLAHFLAGAAVLLCHPHLRVTYPPLRLSLDWLVRVGRLSSV